MDDTDNDRTTGWGVPIVRVAVTVADVDDPAKMDVVVGFTDKV